MTMDGGLRTLFKKHLPQVHWQSIETGMTGRGIPDTNGCFNGHEFWCEFKQTEGWTIGMRPEQIGWLERRARAGGKVFIAVRRKSTELWLLRHTMARVNTLKGLAPSAPVVLAYGFEGPAFWPWPAILAALTAS